MREALLKIILFVFLSASLFLSSGCAGIFDRLVFPPGSTSGAILEGDIPKKFINQLKSTSKTNDEDVPYVFVNMGLHFQLSGDEEKAIIFFERAGEEFRKRKNHGGDGYAAIRKIIAVQEFGHNQEALRLIKVREDTWKDSPMNVFIMFAYGHHNLMSGNYAKACDFLSRAITASDHRETFDLKLLRRDAQMYLGISVILGNDAFRMMKRPPQPNIDNNASWTVRVGKHTSEGIFALHQALFLNEEIKRTKIGQGTPESFFNVMESRIYNFLGLANGVEANWQDARTCLRRSSEISGAAGFRIGELESVFFLTQLHLFEKNFAEGLETAERFEIMADRYRFPFYQIWARYIRAQYYTQSGNTEKAVNILREAVSIPQKKGSGYMEDFLKGTVFCNIQIIYESLVELLACEADYAGAFEAAERAKSAVFVDLLAGRDIGRDAVEESLLAELEQENIRIVSIRNQMLGILDNAALGILLERLERSEEAYRAVITNIQSKNEELSSMVSILPTDLSGIQHLLDQNTTVFDYFVADKVLYVWAVQKNGIQMEKIHISKEGLRSLIFSFRAAIAARDRKKINILSQHIYDTILKPIIPHVAGDRIGFIAHDSLYYLPFGALSNRGQFLVDGFSIFYLPNAGVLKYAFERPLPSGMRILAFGNPDLGCGDMDLPHAEAELEAIKKRFGQAEVFLRREATKERVKKATGNFDIIHFATRSQFVPASPMSSSLLLAPALHDGGRLTAFEILKLRFQGRIVVLSACKTVVETGSNGIETIGLNRAFLYAGSPAVISSLWNANDRATSHFMDTLYRYLEKGVGTSDALKMTQVDFVRKGYDLSVWAPFILMGRY